MRRKRIFSIMVAGFAVMAAGMASAQAWRPAGNVEIGVASGAGGASDRSARLLQKLLGQTGLFQTISVANRPGGGGTVAWTYLSQRNADPHYIATFSSTMLTNHALGVGKLSFRDFTPLSILIREYPMIVVKAGSPINSAKELAARLKADPTSVSFSFAASRGNHNHILVGMIAQAGGANARAIRVVIVKSAGEGISQVLGGHIDAYVGTLATLAPLIESGQLQTLGISAPTRQTGRAANIPTFREQGFDAVYSSWRGFIAPRGLTPAQTAFWDHAFAQVVKADDWKKDLEENAWAEDFRDSVETPKLLESEEKLIAKMLGDLGFLSK
jgi:putative tricarboxylic transport membrane protein